MPFEFSGSLPLNPTPKSVITAMAGFEVAFAFPFVERFSGSGLGLKLRAPDKPRNGRFCCIRAGDHLYGRFCLTFAPPSSRRPCFHPRASQIGADGLSTHSRGLLDLSQRPSQSSQGYDLLFLFVLQDIRHVARGYLPSRCCQCPGRFFRQVWPLFRCSCMAAFGCSLRLKSYSERTAQGSSA